MKLNQKGSFTIIIALIIVLAVVGFYLFTNRATTPSSSLNQPVQQTTTTNQSMQNDSDLTNASNDLDNTAIDATIDPMLNQNAVDANSF